MRYRLFFSLVCLARPLRGTPCVLWSSLLLLSLCLRTHTLAAQEVSFTPRYDGIAPSPKRAKKTATVPPAPVPEQAPKLYSLARFNNRFEDMCTLLETDGHREKLYIVVKQAAEEEKACSSCRALFRQLAQSCSPKMQARRVPTATAVGTPQEAVEPQGEQAVMPPAGQEAVEQGPVQKVTVGVVQKRYPRTDLIAVLSLLSGELYEFDPGKGPVSDALKSLEDRLAATPALTAGERDYFGIVMTYLFAAWAGRPGSPLEGSTPSPDEIAELFK